MSRRTAARLVWSLYGLITCLSTIWSGVGLLSQDGSRNALSGSAALIVEVVGALITCAAFVWLGLVLLSGGGASSWQPVRVS
jgi:hypothetical protein